MKMDENVDLLGFDDGIYDLENKIFRNGEPDDLVSKTVGYDFPTTIDKETKEYILSFLHSIFSCNKDEKFITSSLAYLLTGRRFREKLNIWIGKTRNGKGTLIELLKTTLGEYLKEITPDLFCDSKQSGQANSELAQTKGIRALIASEPDEGKKLQNSFIKRITGGDKINTRELYGKNFEFVPQFSIIIQCNQEPEVKGFDDAYCKRAEVIEFPYCFVDNPIKSNEKKGDHKVKPNFKKIKYGAQFMKMLIDIYHDEDIGNNGFEPSPNVQAKTAEYLKNCNTVYTWFNETCEITDKDSDRIGAKELYQMFCSTEPYIRPNEFKKQLEMKGIQNKRFKTGSFYTRVVYKQDDENDNY